MVTQTQGKQMSNATLSERERLIERWKQALRVLRGMTPHERQRHFNMNYWGHKDECGTVACLAGHCGLDPWFRRRGFSAVWEHSSLWFKGKQRAATSGFSSDGLFDSFFGEGWRTIFYMEGGYGDVVRAVQKHIRKLKAQRA